MSSKIGVNDLVITIKTCERCTCNILGIPFTVTEVVEGPLWCNGLGEAGRFVAARGLRNHSIPLTWLIKIEPDIEPELVDEKEELKV